MAKATNQSGSANIWLGSKQNTRQTILYVPAALTADKPGLLFLESINDGATSSDLGGLYLWADDADALHVSGTYPTNQDDGATILAATTTDAQLLAVAGLTPAADQIIVWDSATAATMQSCTTFAQTILDDANQAAVRTTLGLTPGTDVQAYDATLLSIAALGAADRMLYTTGVDTWAESAITAAGRALLDDAAASNQRTTLGLVIGTDIAGITAGANSDIVSMSGLTGAIATPTTISASSHINTAGDIRLESNSNKLELGASATNSAIYYDGTSLQFEDDDGGVTYTLKQLATGTTLNPLIDGNLTISNGDFDWTNASATEIATWTLAAAAVDGIDIVSSNTTANALHITADSTTSGKALAINADHNTAAGAHIYLDWDESGGDADGRYIVCYDGSGDVLTVKKNGALAIAGDAEGTDAITITDGDITLTDGDLQVVAGYVQADSTDADQSHFKRNNSGSSTAVLAVENTHATGTGYAMSITQAASSGASGGLSISNKGTDPLLYLAAGAARTGYVVHIPMASQLAERALFIDGAITGAVDEGIIEVSATGILPAGANLLRLKSTGNQTAASYLMEIFNAGTPTGASNGTSLYIDDDTGAAATSYAVCIDAATNEAFRVLTGKSLFDEEAEFDGGINVDADSTLDGKLTITASDAASVDGLVIDQNDTNASKSGILVTFDSDGAGIRVTNEKVDGVCYEGICGVNSTTENMMYLDGGAAARWIGADDAAILKIHTDSDFTHAGASMLHIDRAIGTVAASTQGSCLRIVDKSDAGSGYAIEVDASGNTEALNVIAGKSLFAELTTFTAGQQSTPVAVTANATKHTSNAIPDGTTFAQVTSSNSGHFVDLPTATAGNVVWINVGANGYELMTDDSDTVYLNGAIASAGDDASSTVAANVLVRAVCIDSTHWIASTFDAAGTEAALESATS